MPCLVLTGHPCVGKTTFAKLLSERALEHKSKLIRTVVIVNEESACPDQTKAGCYDTSFAEKKTRSALKAEFDRNVSNCASSSSTRKKKNTNNSGGGGGNSTLIILDSLNYIKGYRYELHCISKSAGQRHGVVWLLNNDAKLVKEWNTKRRDAAAVGEGKDDGSGAAAQAYYADETLDELMLRYEPPDARNRWDKPLYRIDVTPLSSSFSSVGRSKSGGGDDGSDQAARDALHRSVYNMHSLSDAIDIDVTKGKSTSSSFKRAGFRRAKPKQEELQQEERPTPPIVDDEAVISTTVCADVTKGKSTSSSFKRAGFRRAKPKQEELQQEERPTPPIVDDKAVVSTTVCADDSPQAGVGVNTKETEEEPKIERLTLIERIDEMLDSFLLDVQPLKEGLSTRQNLTAEANVLHETDSITQQVCTAIMSSQNMAAAGVGGDCGTLSVRIQLGSAGEEETFVLQWGRVVPLKGLQRFRREFLRWVASHPPEDATERGIAESFLSYVQGQMA